MKAKILGVVSALAIMVALTAYAETAAYAGTSVSADTNTSVAAPSTTDEFRQGLENAKDGVIETTQGIGDTAKNAYEDLKAGVMGDAGEVADFSYSTRISAKGMIGAPIYNYKNEKIGTVKDIILDNQGDAALIVVSDGGFMGIGDKLAAFDYDLVVKQEANGDVVMPLTEDIISKVAAFSYDPSEKSDKVQVIPDNGYSVSELLKAKLVNFKNEAVGNIDNITFRQGQADNVIVSFDKKYQIRNEKTAIAFDNLLIERAGDTSLNLRMNQQQTAQFEQYTGKTTTN